MKPFTCIEPLTSSIIFGPVTTGAVSALRFVSPAPALGNTFGWFPSITFSCVGFPPIETKLSSVIYMTALSVFKLVSSATLSLLAKIPIAFASVLVKTLLTLLKFDTYEKPVKSWPSLSFSALPSIDLLIVFSCIAIAVTFPGVIIPDTWWPLAVLSPKENLLNGLLVPIPTTWGKSIL